MTAPRPTREQVEATLRVADEGHGDAHNTRLLADEGRALRAEVEAVATFEPLVEARRYIAALQVERDRLRAALVARTPQPAEREVGGSNECAWIADAMRVGAGHLTKLGNKTSTAADRYKDARAEPLNRVARHYYRAADVIRDTAAALVLAPLPAVLDGSTAVLASRLEGLAREWDWTAGTLDDRAMASGMYRCATDLRANVSALAGDPWGGHVAPAVPNGERPDWHNMRERLHTEIGAIVGVTPREERTGDADGDLIEMVGRATVSPSGWEDVPARLDAAAEALRTHRWYGASHHLSGLAAALREEANANAAEVRAAVASALFRPTEGEHRG